MPLLSAVADARNPKILVDFQILQGPGERDLGLVPGTAFLGKVGGRPLGSFGRQHWAIMTRRQPVAEPMASLTHLMFLIVGNVRGNSVR